MDDIDRKILELLKLNARRTIADIASRVNLSSAPVKRRIERLEGLGVISGYTLRVDHRLVGGALEAFTELRFAGDVTMEKIVATAMEIPEVAELFTTAGDTDALARIRVEDVEHLKEIVNRLRQSDGVIGTKTLMVLESWARDNQA